MEELDLPIVVRLLLLELGGLNPTAARIGLASVAIPCLGGPTTIDP